MSEIQGGDGATAGDVAASRAQEGVAEGAAKGAQPRRQDRKKRRKKRSRPVEPRPERCPNCDTRLEDQYCPHCGQNNRVGRLRLREMLSTGFEHIFELDLPIVRTAVGLTIRPGRVCAEYVSGRRRRYSNPVRYCILTATLYVLVLVVLDIRPSENVLASVRGPAAAETTTPAPGQSGPMAAGGAAEPAAAGSSEPVDEEAAARARRQERGRRIAAYIQATAPRKVEESLHIVIPLSLPIVALGYWLLFRGRRFTYAEHLVFVLFVYGHDLVINAVESTVGMMSNWRGLLVVQVIDTAYITWAATVFYQARWWTVLPRVLLATAWLTVVSVILGTIMVVGWIVWLIGSGEIFERI